MAKLLITYTILFLQFLAAFIITAVLTMSISFVIVMHDPVINDYLETAVCKSASKAFECDFNAQINHLDIFRGTVYLKDVVVLPEKKRDWFWTCESIIIRVNWLKLFLDKQIVLTITCGIMNIETKFVDGSVAISEHIKAFTKEKDLEIPIIPERLHIQQAKITVHINDNTAFCGNVSGAIDLIENRQHIGLTFTQDYIAYKGQPLARDLRLSIKRVTDMVTKKSIHDIHGTIIALNPVDSSCCSGSIKTAIKDDSFEVTFLSDDQKTELKFFKKNSYELKAKNPHGELMVTTDLQGTATILVQSLLFKVNYSLEPESILLAIRDESDQALDMKIHYDGRCQLQGTTGFFHALLQKNIVPQEYATMLVPYKKLLSYKSPFVFKGMKTPKHWQGELDLSGLHVRIPYTYNFLRSYRTGLVYATDRSYLLLRDTQLQTDRGRLSSAISTLCLDENNTVHYAHVPIMVQDFFISRAKDFFAELSGACVIDYQKNERSKIEGICTIKKCHIRNNPFSGGAGNDIVSATINPFESHPLANTADLNLFLKSYEPVEIKTSFLQARAHVNFHLLGTVAQPQLYGHIELIQGTLNFPYKPLEIRYGKIFFFDNEREDPAIELSASAVIKNYAVTLHVEGTAQNPVITFQSTPSLQEEQIIGLLFGGSPDSSLSLVMPLSSMGMVEKLIVGSSDEFLHDDSFKNWLGPLQNVKIVPRFSDQTSRGGLRAALAIEVNDNLSALIQQNFSLSEDTLIEVAYKPLDELTIRGIRDERGDFGGEVEARFTW